MFGFVFCEEGDDDGDHAGFGDGFSVGGNFVFGDADPGGLALAEVGGRRKESVNHVDDALDDGTSSTIACYIGKLDRKECFSGAEESFLFCGAVGVAKVFFRRLFVGKATMNEKWIVHNAPFFPHDAVSAGFSSLRNCISSVNRYA